MNKEVNINTELLLWAINRSGHDMESLFKRFPNLEKWLIKEKKPTLKQLELLSKKLYVPFGYLFLATPPVEKMPIPFFRTNSLDKAIGLNVFETILQMQKRQDWLRDYLIENGNSELPFVGKFANIINVKEIVSDIRKTLNLKEDWTSHFSTWNETLSFLTEKIEDIGIIVAFNGVVGNNTSRKIPIEECRGFVLVDQVAPFLFINNADAKSAQMFTLIHELAHVWIGESAGFDFRQLQPANDNNELLCDQIAAEFLVPEDKLPGYWEGKEKIKELSKIFKVSPIVIARRALDLKLFTKSEFFEFYNEYIGREYARKHSSSGGDFYLTTKKRLSISFATHVHNALKSNKILYRDAYKLTNLKGETFTRFFQEHIY